MITIEQFTELAHRTASRYSHRSEPARAFYTFSPEALADFHRQACAAVAQAQRVPDGWLIKETERNEIIVQAPNADPGGLTIPPGPGGSPATRLLESLCRALLASTPAPAPAPAPAQQELRPFNAATLAQIATVRPDLIPQMHGIRAPAAQHQEPPAAPAPAQQENQK